MKGCKRIIIGVCIGSMFSVYGCSPVVEPHLANPEASVSIDSSAQEKFKGNAEGIVRELVNQKSNAKVEGAKAPTADSAVNQTNVSTLNMYLQLPTELLNNVQFYLELFDVNFGDITSYREITQNDYEFIDCNNSTVEILMCNDYFLIGNEKPILLCMSYDGNLVESYDGRSWKNYDGSDHDYADVYGSAVVNDTRLDQNVMVIAARSQFKNDYPKKIAEVIWDTHREGIKEFYLVAESIYRVEFEDGVSKDFQIMILNTGSDREDICIKEYE